MAQECYLGSAEGRGRQPPAWEPLHVDSSICTSSYTRFLTWLIITSAGSQVISPLIRCRWGLGRPQPGVGMVLPGPLTGGVGALQTSGPRRPGALPAHRPSPRPSPKLHLGPPQPPLPTPPPTPHGGSCSSFCLRVPPSSP